MITVSYPEPVGYTGKYKMSVVAITPDETIGDKNNLPELPIGDCTGRCRHGRNFSPTSATCIDCEDYPVPPDGLYYDPRMDATIQLRNGNVEIL